MCGLPGCPEPDSIVRDRTLVTPRQCCKGNSASMVMRFLPATHKTGYAWICDQGVFGTSQVDSGGAVHRRVGTTAAVRGEHGRYPARIRACLRGIGGLWISAGSPGTGESHGTHAPEPRCFPLRIMRTAGHRGRRYPGLLPAVHHRNRRPAANEYGDVLHRPGDPDRQRLPERAWREQG